MRVVHVVSGDLWAGAAVATFHLLLGLREAGADARAIVLARGELADRLEHAGLLAAVESERAQRFPSLARAVRGHAEKADLVHAHGYKEDVLAALSGRPWIATQHGRPEPHRGFAHARFAAYDALDRCAQRRARRVVAVSREIEAWLAARVGEQRVVHAWNGIADPAAGRAPAPWQERPRRIGVVARLHPVKGVDLAIRAIAWMPDVELDVVGDGPARARLESLARRVAPGRVRFVGFDPDPGAHLGGWRLLLVPSLHEGNPIAVLEAMAFGTPVVAGPLPGVDETLGGCGGLLLPDRDPDGWAAAIDAALADVEWGARASLAARARFEACFTARAAAQRMLGIYGDALAVRATARRAP
ncbi:MAG: hypothetical protein DCC71_06140 [Proteobacteria bacterium]|nr:MAG: hypothetical protein DCC71_06140 [Pseudomonadota bacterium]